MSALASGRRGIASMKERVRSATPRERMMLAALATAFTLIVLSAGIKWLKLGLAERRALQGAEEAAHITLDNAPFVDAALKAKSEKLAGKRLSASDFFAAVEALARESGLTAEASTPKTDKSGGLTVFRMKVNVRAGSARKLMDFDDRLRLKGESYVVERVTIDSRPSSGELSAAYELATCQPSE